MDLPGPVEAVLLGAGNRGADAYGEWALAHPGELRFVAVAEPDLGRRERFSAAHGIPVERRFAAWRDLLTAGPRAPALVMALPDREHEAASSAALRAGYHALLEKPLASTLAGTLRVARAARPERVVMLGYVLRHTAFFSTVREVVRSGRLGEVVTVAWRENVSSAHFAHSYVRGSWARVEESSPMILAKSSHDLDLLGWTTGRRVARLSSFGSLEHFRPERAPAGAPERCLDGCPAAQECPFYAPKHYLSGRAGWPVSVVSLDPSPAAVERALREGPYGRCVYRSGSTAVDHQVVAFELEGGGSGTLTVHGHSGEEGRTVRVDGTRATLRGAFTASRQELRIEPHDARTAFAGGGEDVPVRAPVGMAGGGHGGGDGGLAAAFVAAVREGRLESPESYLESHLLAFAAEEARLTGRVVDLRGYRRSALGS